VPRSTGGVALRAGLGFVLPSGIEAFRTAAEPLDLLAQTVEIEEGKVETGFRSRLIPPLEAVIKNLARDWVLGCYRNQVLVKLGLT
jgi:hypothetical protein